MRKLLLDSGQNSLTLEKPRMSQAQDPKDPGCGHTISMQAPLLNYSAWPSTVKEASMLPIPRDGSHASHDLLSFRPSQPAHMAVLRLTDHGSASRDDSPRRVQENAQSQPGRARKCVAARADGLSCAMSKRALRRILAAHQPAGDMRFSKSLEHPAGLPYPYRTSFGLTSYTHQRCRSE